MSRACDHAIEQIYFYLDREMSWFRRRRITRHLHKCGFCGGAYAFEERLLAVIQERCRDEPPPELFDRLRTLLRHEAVERPNA